MSNGVPSAEGRFVWFEYASSKVAQAQGQFGELFNWTTKPVPMPGGEYVMIAAADGRTIGGYITPAKPTPRRGRRTCASRIAPTRPRTLKSSAAA